MSGINNDNGRVGDGIHGHQNRKDQENNGLGEKIVLHETIAKNKIWNGNIVVARHKRLLTLGFVPPNSSSWKTL
jgi:hypothetical protein